MRKKIVVNLGFLLLLSLGFDALLYKGQAELVTPSGKKQIDLFNELKNYLKNNDNELLTLEAEIHKIKNEREINLQAMTDIKTRYIEIESEAKTLEEELNQLEKRLSAQLKKLNERKEFIQKSGVNETYFDVVADSFSNETMKVEEKKSALIIDYSSYEKYATEITTYNTKKELLQEKQVLLEILNNLHKEKHDKINEQQLYQQRLKKQIEILQIEKNQLQEAINNYEIQRAHIGGIPPSTRDYVKTVISVGEKYIGHSSYVYGGGRTSEDVANGRFDCSAFVHWAFAQAGIDIGQFTDTIKYDGEQVSYQEIQPGDLVFFDTYKKDGHVGIYIGDGKFIGAQTSTGVAIEDMTNGYWQDTFNGRVVRIYS